MCVGYICMYVNGEIIRDLSPLLETKSFLLLLSVIVAKLLNKCSVGLTLNRNDLSYNCNKRLR
jgi:hypothetical protein